MAEESFHLKILIFAAEMAYRAADQVGLLKKEYSPYTYIIRNPCTSLLRPELVLHALEKGFDGVFIASSGPNCPFMGETCVKKTSTRAEKTYELLKVKGIDVEGVKSAGICSTCVDAFVNQVEDLNETLASLGPVGGGNSGS